MRNAVRLGGRIVERQPLRYTPAGIAIVQLRLSHRSRQNQARLERDIDLDIAATAAGDIAQRLDPVALGTLIEAAGFLAQRSRNVRSAVLHITEFEIIED